MKLFAPLWDKVLKWSEHAKAPYYLAGVSFAESSFFPIPPDVMLIPMTLAKPQKVRSYIGLTVGGSVLGSIVGYGLGAVFFHLFEPYIEYFGYVEAYSQVVSWFSIWDVWLILAAGFLPVPPYKLFTVAAGALGMAFLPFILLCLISRGLRFLIVGYMVVWGGERLYHLIHRYIEALGLGCILAGLIYLWWVI